MTKRYQLQVLWGLTLLISVMVVLCTVYVDSLSLPSPIITVALVAAFLLIWHFSLPAPTVGIISLERLPQIATLLVVGPVESGLINAIAAIIWPFTSRSYSQGSWRIACIRALHNAPMVVAIHLIAGHFYELAGGRYQIQTLQAADLAPLIVLALTMQVANTLMMTLFFRLDGRDVTRLLTTIYALADLLVVPAGVLTGLLFLTLPTSTFLLYCGVMLALVVSVSSLKDHTTQASVPSLAHDLSGAMRVDAMAQNVLDRCRMLFAFDEFFFVLADREQDEQELRLLHNGDRQLTHRRRPMSRGLFGQVLQSGESILVSDWTRADQKLRERVSMIGEPPGSAMIVPIVVGDEIIGLVSLQSHAVDTYSEPDLYLLQQLAEQIAQPVADARAFEQLDDYKFHLEDRVNQRTAALEQLNAENERLVRKLRRRGRLLERQNREDALTGIANRRCFDETLETCLAEAAAANKPLSIALFDIDHFKQVNDDHGHLVGDQVLRRCAQLLESKLSDDHLAARYGGEEFAVLLDHCDINEAGQLAEKIRRDFEAENWQRLAPIESLTVSAGVVAFEVGMTPIQLLAIADLRLYAAKAAGRNRVVVDSPD